MSLYQINIYRTNFRRDENAIYGDSLEEFNTILNSFAPAIWTATFTANIKPNISSIKLNVDQSYYDTGLSQWNYMMIMNTSTKNKCYYYIDKTEWVAEGTARFDITLDVLNTYRPKFTSNTHITRQFKDRWKKLSSKVYEPIIDKYPEDISKPTLHKSLSTAITGEKWHLVYYSNNSDETAASIRPISCLCYGEEEHELGNTESQPLTVTPDDLESGAYYCCLNGDNPAEGIAIGPTGLKAHFFTESEGEFATYFRTYEEDNTTYIKAFTTKLRGNFETPDKTIIEKASSIEFVNSTILYYTGDDYDYTRTSRSSDRNVYIYSAMELSGNPLPAFDDIYRFIKTSTTINKIIELPCAPFIFHEGTVPAGWIVTEAFGKPALLRQDYVTTLGNIFTDDIDVPTYNLGEYSIETPYDLKLETKIYNSNYYQVKYVYDVNSYDLQLEYGYNPVTITFSVADEMSSNILFQFKSDTPIYSDMGNYISSVRSLEIPIYSSNYLEYMRYGKSIDEKNLAYSITGQAMSMVSSATQASASSIISGSMVKNKVIAPVGIAISSLSSAVSLGMTIAKSTDQINQKIESNRRQANNQSTTNDLSILNKSLGNQLNKMIYIPDDYIKESIQNYFRLYGYACDDYGIPTDSRYWNDYYVAEVEFDPSDDLTQILTPEVRSIISSAYSDGVRKYHWHGKLDLNKDYENWELSIKS